MKWNERITVRRKLLGWTQENAAHKIGCAQTQLSQWENGKYMPNPEHRKKIAAVYGSTVETLFF